MIRYTAPIILAVLLAGCGDASSPDAQSTKDMHTGGAAGTAGDNPICKLFKADELTHYVGSSLGPGQNASGGLGCQWTTQDDNGDVMIVIVPKTYHEVPSLAEGYKELPGIGIQGFSAPSMGGWTAAAIVGEESIRVSAAGEAASAASAEALLQETIKRGGNPAP